jgi:hypothetical protein
MATPTILIVPDRFKSGVLYSQLPESGAVDFDVTRATTAFRVNASGILESVASGVPRLDYPAAGGCPSLLVEPAATNLFRNSEPATDPGQGTRENVTFAVNDWGGGYSSLLAGKVTLNTASGTVTANYQNISSNQNGDITIACIARRVDGAEVIESSETGDLTTADFTMLLRVNPQSIAPPIRFFKQNLGNGLWFFSKTINEPSTATSIIGVRKSSTSRLVDVEVSAIMVVAGNLPLNLASYIKTTGSSATRNADVISKTGVSGFIGQTQGTIYAEVDLRANSNLGTILSLGPNTATYIAILKRANNTIGFEVLNSGVQANISSATVSSGVFKIAAAYSSNDFVLYVNGAQAGTDTSGTVPTASQVTLGAYPNNSFNIDDRIRAAAIYTTRLSNAELAALTTL